MNVNSKNTKNTTNAVISFFKFLEKNGPKLLQGGMTIVLLVRFVFYVVHFFPGFGEFTWSKIEQKELYVKRMMDELEKAKKKPGIYQSLKYYDIVSLFLFAWFLYLTEKNQSVAFFKFAIGMTLLNYA
jgi:K+ transporter